MKYPWK